MRTLLAIVTLLLCSAAQAQITVHTTYASVTDPPQHDSWITAWENPQVSIVEIDNALALGSSEISGEEGDDVKWRATSDLEAANGAVAETVIQINEYGQTQDELTFHLSAFLRAPANATQFQYHVQFYVSEYNWIEIWWDPTHHEFLLFGVRNQFLGVSEPFYFTRANNQPFSSLFTNVGLEGEVRLVQECLLKSDSDEDVANVVTAKLIMRVPPPPPPEE